MLVAACVDRCCSACFCLWCLKLVVGVVVFVVRCRCLVFVVAVASCLLLFAVAVVGGCLLVLFDVGCWLLFAVCCCCRRCLLCVADCCCFFVAAVVCKLVLFLLGIDVCS